MKRITLQLLFFTAFYVFCLGQSSEPLIIGEKIKIYFRH